MKLIQGTPARSELALDKFTRELQGRARRDWDNLVILVGERGVGKSSASLELAGRVDPTFTLEERIAYLPEDILPMANSLPWGGGRTTAMLVDEVGEAWGSADFATQVNRTLRKAFIGNRYKNLTVFFCCPHFSDAETGLRRMARFLVSCKSRSQAVVYDLERDQFMARSYPYRKTKFLWSRLPLPKSVYEAYREVKVARGEERLQKYQDQVEAQGGGIDGEKALAEVLLDPEQYTNSQGYVDMDLVWSSFKERGLSKREARAVAVRASKVTRPRWLEAKKKGSAKKAAETRKKKTGKKKPRGGQ